MKAFDAEKRYAWGTSKVREGNEGHLIAAEDVQHSSVTPEVAGSSPVTRAIPLRKRLFLAHRAGRAVRKLYFSQTILLLQCAPMLRLRRPMRMMAKIDRAHAAACPVSWCP